MVQITYLEFIGLTFISFCLVMIGYFLVLKPLKGFISLKKNYQKAKDLINDINKKYPESKAKSDLEIREERERALINSGLSLSVLDKVMQDLKNKEVNQNVEKTEIHAEEKPRTRRARRFERRRTGSGRIFS